MSYQNFDPTLESYAEKLTLLSFVLTTIIMPLIVYLIVTKSKRMKTYRYYLINSVIWAYSFQLLIFIARPVVLLPSFCILFYPIVSIARSIIQSMLCCTVVIAVNMDMAVLWSLLYRYSQVNSFQFFSTKRFRPFL
jgi:hypothetical protein